MTIIDSIVTNDLVLTNGYNYFTSEKLNMSSIRKGYIPMIRLLSGSLTTSVNLRAKAINETYPDYICYNVSLTNETLIGLTNLKNILTYLGSKKTNIAVQFRFEDVTLKNLTFDCAYTTLGTFIPFLYTQFGANSYGTLNKKLIHVNNIDFYPFQGKFLFKYLSRNI